jgi:hypothetical protein
MLDEEYEDRNDNRRYILGRIGGYCCHCVSTSGPDWPSIHSRRRSRHSRQHSGVLVVEYDFGKTGRGGNCGRDASRSEVVWGQIFRMITNPVHGREHHRSAHTGQYERAERLHCSQILRAFSHQPADSRDSAR